MISITLRRTAATLVLAAAASLTASLAGEPASAPAAAPAAGQGNAQVVEPPSKLPPKAYEIPKRGVSDAIRKAIESPDRTPEMRARDGYRRPAEILALTGIRPGMRVVQFGPYPYYYTELISKIIGPKGELYVYEHPYIEEQIGDMGKKFAEAHPNVKYDSVDLNGLELPRNVDIIFNIMSFQKMLLTNTEVERIHTTMFKAMKPGGVYLVIEPAAEHGVGTDDIGRLRRIDPGVIRPYITGQGFALDEDSRLLENPQDDHKGEAFDDDAVDVSDRIVYKFKKPVIY